MSIRNLSDTNPAAPSGKRNAKFQISAPYDDGTGRILRDISANYDPVGSVQSKVANYSAAIADHGTMIVFNGSSLQYALANPVPSSVWFVAVRNDNATALTIFRNGRTIDGAAADISLNQNDSAFIFSDGTNYHTVRGSSGGGTWGSITGTLSAQSDLWTALLAAASTAVWGSITGTLSSQSDLNSALALKAPLASPALTGTPTAPTAGAGTNTTQLASTAFVQAALGHVIGAGFLGNPAAGQTIFGYTVELPSGFTTITFAANFAGCAGNVLANPGSTQTFTVKKRHSGVSTNIGTFAVDSSGNFTFTTTSGATQTAVNGDLLYIDAPNPIDGTIAGIFATFVATRS